MAGQRVRVSPNSLSFIHEGLAAFQGLPFEEAEPAGPRPEFPCHEVLGQIGREGMGVVYRARDVRLGRIVAIKTLAESKYATREQLDRFRDEARAVARLRHPNIIGIHAIDEHEGRPYIATTTRLPPASEPSPSSRSLSSRMPATTRSA
jgi:serine/threonine protein kinase